MLINSIPPVVAKEKNRKFKIIRKIQAYLKRYYTPKHTSKQYENKIEGKTETNSEGLKHKWTSKGAHRIQSCRTLPCLNDIGLVLQTEMTVVSNFLSQEKRIQNRVSLLGKFD